MSISEKIKTIDDKIDQNKAQYNLDRQTAKISDLSSANISKYEFLTGKDVLPEKDLLEKAAGLKRFEYSPLDKELRAQTDIAKKTVSKIRNTFEFNEIIKKEKPTLENYSISDLIYDSKHRFYKYSCDKEKFTKLSLELKHSILVEFLHDLEKLNNLNPKEESTKKDKNKCV